MQGAYNWNINSAWKQAIAMLIKIPVPSALLEFISIFLEQKLKGWGGVISRGGGS